MSRFVCGERDLVTDVEGDRVEAQVHELDHEPRRLYRVVGVMGVEEMQVVAREAVGADQHSTRTQKPKCFGKRRVLLLVGRNVVKHGERADGIERLVPHPGVCAVTMNDPHIASGVPGGQRTRGILVELQGSQSPDTLAEKLGGAAGTGPQLQHVLAELDAGKQSRQDFSL